MKTMMLASLALAALPAAALAQDGPRMWSDLAETRNFPQQQGDGRRGGQVVEEWYTPRLRASLSIYGRVSFPSSTDVTVDGLWYSDFFNPGLGVSGEFDLLSYISPRWGVGGYLSVGWDRFEGQRINFLAGDFVEADHMDQTTVIIGGKIVDHVTPFFLWEGRMGLGMVHYSAVNWSGVDTGVPFFNEQLFRASNQIVWEIGGRVGFGDRHIQVDLGFGIRIMGGAERGRDVTNAINPDILTTFMIELGLTFRF